MNNKGSNNAVYFESIFTKKKKKMKQLAHDKVKWNNAYNTHPYAWIQLNITN